MVFYQHPTVREITIIAKISILRRISFLNSLNSQVQGDLGVAIPFPVRLLQLGIVTLKRRTAAQKCPRLLKSTEWVVVVVVVVAVVAVC